MWTNENKYKLSWRISEYLGLSTRNAVRYNDIFFSHFEWCQCLKINYLKLGMAKESGVFISISTVPSDGLAPLGRRTSAGTARWRHQMETFSALLAICAGNSPAPGEFPTGPVNSPHKGQWHGALVFSLICIWINGWVNNREAGDLRRHRAHYDFIVMSDSCPVYMYLEPALKSLITLCGITEDFRNTITGSMDTWLTI